MEKKPGDAGSIKIVRRIVRKQITRLNGLTGLEETFVGVVQTSNLYAFSQIDVDHAYERFEQQSTQVYQQHSNQPLLSLLKEVTEGIRLKPPQRQQNWELFA